MIRTESITETERRNFKKVAIRPMKNSARIILLVLLGIIIFAGFSVYSYVSVLPDYLSATLHEEDVMVTVREGASLRAVADTLHDEGVIRNRYWFRKEGQEAEVDRSIRPGTYLIPAGAEYEEIFSILQRGEPIREFTVTIPEGFTLYQMGERIEENDLFTREEFLEATETYYRVNDFDFDNEELFFSLEGYLFPDTYRFSIDESLESIISRMHNRMLDMIDEEDRAVMEEQGLSLHEVLTIASLIERESAFPAENERISGVINNRLDREMLLQIDVSVIYAYGEGQEHFTLVLYEHLEVENPFNTYQYAGLPPGPIAAPGRSAIQAAIYPEEHSYIFYVVGEEGHVFAETYDQHLVNVQAYREIQQQSEEDVQRIEP